MLLRLLAIVGLAAVVPGAVSAAPAFVEYPGHPATYGDHTINAVWTGGPVASVLVELETDESILHDDGVGQSQRTARNTLTFVAPSSSANPQDFDNLGLTTRYGSRLPLLQQLAADGTSVLTYRFPVSVTAGFDLFVTDVDAGDAAKVRAFGPANAAIDMTSWRLVQAGDLSLYKNTGANVSAIVAPTPTTTFATDAISLTAVDDANYNRSFAILRAPVGAAVEQIEIEFTGDDNSPSRALGGNGSHIYLGLATSPESADFDGDGSVAVDDLAIWADAFGINPLGDADADGDSDGADFLVWQRQLGAAATAPASGAAPEPTAAALAVIGLIANVCRPRRLRGVA